ncbi:MAG: aminotransferase class IV, partial [Nitrospiraceae bacterium]
AAGVFDALMLNWEHHLTECTVSNLFFVTGRCLRTPAVESGLLDGITRSIVIQLAAELRISVEEGRFTPDHLYQADECFLTNTSMEIMPVTSVDHRPIGEGKPGTLTLKLRQLFRGTRERFLEPASTY